MPGRLAAWLDLLLPRACFRCDGPPPAEGALCRACLGALARPDLPRLPGLDAVAAGAAYTGEVEGFVRAFKYAPAFVAPDPAPEAILLELLVRAAREDAGALPGCVVPVPLHRRRLRRRGFNPAGRLARGLARRFALPFEPVALRRTRDTPSQTGLDARARRRNVAGAFAARPGRVAERIWLVDDVVTTGATLGAAARALRQAGAVEVVGVCAAATPRAEP